MKSLIQLVLTTGIGFSFGCALMYREEPQLMVVAGVLTASAFFAAYLILFIAHAIFKRLFGAVRFDDGFAPESMLGFDSHGKLKIESPYHQK